MAYTINNSRCTQCGTCVEACPSGAVNENHGSYTIDASSCFDCGTCADYCPGEAISPDYQNLGAVTNFGVGDFWNR